MPADERLNALEGEFKLLRGEVKQSLVDVRDFLLSLKLPQREYDDQDAPQPEETGPEPVAPPRQQEPFQEALGPPRLPENQAPWVPLVEEQPDIQSAVSRDWMAAAPEGPSFPAQTVELEAEQDQNLEMPRPEEESPHTREGDKVNKSDAGERGSPGPQVNMLTNLIRWVLSARAEVGTDQVPALLDIFAMSGHMQPGLKEMILKLADSLGEQQGPGGSADTWSRLAQELHGILSGGGDPAELRLPEAEKEREKEKETDTDQPVRLRLVLPGSDGSEREFAINLMPEAAGNGRSGGNGNSSKGEK